MRANTSRLLRIALSAASAVFLLVSCSYAISGRQALAATGPGTANRRIGAIKAINGSAITLTPDSGPDVNIAIQPTTRILRIAPGEKDLKNATPIQLPDLQVGDRILVGGKASDDNLSVVASTVVVMKHSDLETRHKQELEDWQKRGVGGVVTAEDAAAGTVTISVGSFASKKSVTVHISSATVIRRYAPDSVKFDDAKPSMLQEIHPGDQVRARGDLSADGSGLTAEEIVSGSFRSIAGTVSSVDASASTLSVQDLLSKKSVMVKVTGDSQLRRLPPEMAQRIAMRLKGAAAAGIPGAPSSGSATKSQGAGVQSTGGQGAPPSGPPSGMSAGGSAAGGRSGGAPDFQQMLSHVPAVSLADLHKGDAVIILATEGTAGVGTTITLVSGVEQLLQAAPSASSAAMLTPWTMGAPSTGDAGGP
jgi:hypothetical protein